MANERKPGISHSTIGISLACWAVAAWVFFEAWQDVRNASADQPSECTIVEWTTEEATDADDYSNGHYAVVTIAHEVDGHPYQRSDRSEPQSTSSDAIAVAKAYRTGETYPCMYVDGHPELVMLFEKEAASALPMAGFGVFMLLMPLLVHGFERRNAARKGDAS